MIPLIILRIKITQAYKIGVENWLGFNNVFT